MPLLWLTLLLTAQPELGTWSELAPLPDREGLAGAFAGVSNDTLLVAGGANFPGKRPWEGGEKVWYDTVFALDGARGDWKIVGKLPRPLGYGVSATHADSLVCVGGSDANQHHAQAFRLRLERGKLEREDLPDLPRPMANACGAIVGSTLYVAGGTETPGSTTALATCYRIDLSAKKPEWEQLANLPGPGRMLAVAAVVDDTFWVVGGVKLERATDGTARRAYLTDGYRYHPEMGWQRTSDLPHPSAAAASPAPGDATGFWLLGGDTGDQQGVAPSEHRGFSKSVLRYERNANTWQHVADLPTAPVTLPCVRWHGSWILPSGEVRPGIRTPSVWQWKVAP